MDTESQEGLEPPWVNTSDPFLKTLVHFKCWVKTKQDSSKAGHLGAKQISLGPRPLGMLPVRPRAGVSSGHAHLQPLQQGGEGGGDGSEISAVTKGSKTLGKSKYFKNKIIKILSNSWQQRPEFKYSSVAVRKMLWL